MPARAKVPRYGMPLEGGVANSVTSESVRDEPTVAKRKARRNWICGGYFAGGVRVPPYPPILVATRI